VFPIFSERFKRLHTPDETSAGECSVQYVARPRVVRPGCPPLCGPGSRRLRRPCWRRVLGPRPSRHGPWPRRHPRHPSSAGPRRQSLIWRAKVPSPARPSGWWRLVGKPTRVWVRPPDSGWPTHREVGQPTSRLANPPWGGLPHRAELAGAAALDGNAALAVGEWSGEDSCSIGVCALKGHV
jgi:hypothetical protein